jgi:cytochrome c oxidase subunit 3
LDHVNKCPVKSRMQFPLWLVVSLLILFSWFDSIKFESLQGYHTKKVNKDYVLGFILFLISEAMFFFSIFWAFCHFTLSSSLEFAFIWPPVGIEQINYFQLPLINTMLLIVSGLFLTVSHNFLKKEDFLNTAINLVITIFLGVGFLCVQWHEYMNISFNINDSVVGSIFYFGTGFHGLHVLLGLIALIYNLLKLYNRELSKKRHYSFLFAIWYWHFVYIILIALYILFYVWGLQW